MMFGEIAIADEEERTDAAPVERPAIANPYAAESRAVAGRARIARQIEDLRGQSNRTRIGDRRQHH